ncbi:autotransporter outer membrane beta-barrel domain-containing protein [Serratia marcescens]
MILVSKVNEALNKMNYVSTFPCTFRKKPVAICIGILLSVAIQPRVSAQNYNSPVIVSGGAQLNLENDSTITVTGNSATIAMQSLGQGSSISAENLSIFANGSSQGMSALSGGTINLFGGGEVSTVGDYSTGVAAYGSGSNITITGISTDDPFGISTRGVSSVGVNAGASGGTITLNNVMVTTSGISSHGVFVNDGGTLTSNNSTFATTGDLSKGLYAVGVGAVGNNNNVTVTTSGQQAAGIHAADGGQINVTGNSRISTSGESSSALVSESFSGTAGTAVSLIAGTGNTINIETGGNNASGAVAQLAGSTINMDGVNIQTRGQFANGIYSNADAVVKAQNSIIRTSGAQSAGAAALNNATLTMNNVGIITDGDEAQGVSSSMGANVTMTGGSVSTKGKGSYALRSVDAGSATTATDINITTAGDASANSTSAAVVAEFGGTTTVKGNSGITTMGQNGIGLLSQVNGGGLSDTTVNAGDGINTLLVSTSGDNAYGAEACSRHNGSMQCSDGLGVNDIGADAGSNAVMNLNGVAITTSGVNGYGIYAVGAGAQVAGSKTNITTTGGSAHAVALRDGGTINLSDSTLKAVGVGAVGAYFTGGGNSLTLTNSSLSSTQAEGVYAKDGSASISLTSSSLQGNGTAVSVAAGLQDATGSEDTVTLSANQGSAVEGNIVAGRQFVGTFDNSVLNGNVTALSPENLSDNATLVFANNSVMTGSAQGVSRATFSDSVWNMTDSSTITGTASGSGGLALQNGTVNFVPNGTNYKTLTVSALNGTGTFVVNTELNEGGANTHSDQLHVTGNTGGDYSVKVNNTVGTGAKTVGDGIKIAQLDGDSTGTTVRLGNYVTAGAYEYLLYQGGSQDKDDWYLRSDLTNQEPDPGTGPTTPPIEPSYNPSVPGYVIGPYLNRMYGFDTVGTLHERVGDQENLRKNQAIDQGIWGRISGGETKSSKGRFNYDADTWFAQFGGDLYQAYSESGARTHAGVTATLGQTSSNMKDPARSSYQGRAAETGSVNTKGYGFGIYYTRYAADSSYVDTVAQYTHYRNDYSSLYGENASQNGDGMTLSVEVGKPFKADNGWFIEPQAQIMYQYLHLDGIDDGVATVSSTRDNSGLARVGARLGYDSGATSNVHPYVTADVLSVIGRSPDVTVSNTRLHQDYSSQWGELGAGVTGDITKNTSVYADLKYKNGFDGDMHGFTGNLGVRVNW